MGKILLVLLGLSISPQEVVTILPDPIRPTGLSVAPDYGSITSMREDPQRPGRYYAVLPPNRVMQLDKTTTAGKAAVFTFPIPTGAKLLSGGLDYIVFAMDQRLFRQPVAPGPYCFGPGCR